MPSFTFTSPEGKRYTVNGPDGATKEQAFQILQGQLSAQKPTEPKQPDSSVMGDLKNALGGFARSGMGVVSNLMRPIDYLTGDSNDARMARVNQRFQNQGYDPNSLAFQAGKLGGDVAVTAPIGGMLAAGAKYVPALTKAVPGIETALRTGGMKLGTPAATTLPQMAGNALTRAVAGAAVGGASAGMVNLDDTGTGAVLGGALPGAVKLSGLAGNAINSAGQSVSRKLMQSAVKPTIDQLRKGEAQVAIDTLLKYGINPTTKGVEKLRGMVDDINSQISDKIAGSNATINKTDVMDYLADPAKRFSNQVSPTSDLNAIAGVADDFVNHPGFPGNTIPVQAAQALKQGTYKALAGKYGEVGSASTEAQKALARGLKDKIGQAVPEVVPLNAEEGNLLKTLKVTERRALMDLNKNPVGLSALAQNPSMFALFMADRSAAFKGLAARMVNRASGIPSAVSPYADSLLANPVVRNAGLLSISGSP